MGRARAVLVAVGLLALAYGGWLLVRTQRPGQLAEAAAWALAGVVLHDGVVAPLALGLGWVGQRVLPRSAARPAAVALLLVGTLTIVAIPVLDGYAARGPNRTLLDRDYGGGWLLVVGVVLVATAAGSALAGLVHRSRRRTSDGPGARRR